MSNQNTGAPVVKKSSTFSQEVDWLRREGAKYTGEWVALQADVLVDHDRSYRNLRERLSESGQLQNDILITKVGGPLLPNESQEHWASSSSVSPDLVNQIKQDCAAYRGTFSADLIDSPLDGWEGQTELNWTPAGVDESPVTLATDFNSDVGPVIARMLNAVPVLMDARAAEWRRDEAPRGVRCLVTWTGEDGRSTPKVKVASVSLDYAEERWYSDGERLHHVVAWMPAPLPAELKGSL